MNLGKKYASKYKMLIGTILSLKISSTAIELIIPMTFVYMVNEIVPQESVSLLMRWGGMMILVAVVSSMVSLFVAHLSAKLGVGLSNDLRTDLFEKSCALSCEQVDNITISSITSRLTSDISTLQMFVMKMLTKGVKMIITLLGSLTSVVLLDMKLAMIMVIAMPLIGVVVYFTTTISFKRFQLTKRANDQLVKTIRENVIGIRVIKALSKNEYEMKRFGKINDVVREKNVSASSVDVVGSPTMKFIVNLGMVATLVLGAYWVSIGESDAVTIIAFMSYFTMLFTSLVNIGQMFTSFSRAKAAESRIQDILSEKIRTYEISEQENNIARAENDSYIEFRDVTFSYGNQTTLENISFQIKKGEMLGIIGGTGSGKTTIIQLLLRLYEPTEGEILIHNKPITMYTKETLYQMFGVVFQSDMIFPDTVAENISFGRNLELEEIKYAGKSAQAEPFIQKLQKEYEAMVNVRGQNISGGEKQRLLIARALAGKPDILVLDDATSALDYKTDAKLRGELSRNYQNSTKILVSQRVASIMNAEQILVIEKGRIIEKGTHKQLLETCPLYEQIASLQLGDSGLYAS